MTWEEANDRYLGAALARVRRCLELQARRLERTESTAVPEAGDVESGEAITEDAFPEEAPPALAVLCRGFDLSPFERDVLVLAAGAELDPSFASLCAAAQGSAERPYPSFSLALEALRDAHWSAIAPDASLRAWRLVAVGTGDTVTTSPLRIEERVLHYLRGLETMDESLAGLMSPLASSGALVPSHREVAEQLAGTWMSVEAESRPPVAQLCGNDSEGKRAVAAAAVSALGFGVNVLSASALPNAPAELDGLLRLLGREAVLAQRALMLDCDDVEASDTARASAVATFAEHYRGALILTCPERRCLPRVASVPFDVERPADDEQAAVWRSVLGEAAAGLDGRVEALVSHFDLGTEAIQAAGFEALGRASRSGKISDPEELGRSLWQSCLAHARPSLDALAQRMRPVAGWDDLVLPDSQRDMLREIAVHVRQRHRVYQEWGFAARSLRGLGITALFSGQSGTGKTLAAEVLADELGLDLYRIDLATVVSKYIGETEKNLKKIFDAADAGGAILLFDEADALFGKRSEVKDSHDRYANIEVSYLLQRMEEYRGLAILTTNMQAALDPAFLRRIRFIVQFPFPDAASRTEIWERILPPETPTEGLDAVKLGQMAVAGGNIRNIALGAAFLAAEDGTAVGMGHVLRAARSEYAKLEKPLTSAEIGDWQV